MQITERHLRMLRSDTSEGFGLFYHLMHGRVIPEHVLGWIDALYKARKDKKPGILFEAFRGSTKTTTFMTYLAYQVGLYPDKSNLVVQVSDDIARDNMAAVAYLIQQNPAWRIPFQHVVPGKSWGADGYEVIRNDISEFEWSRLISTRKDPTFVGVGRTSRAIIGKHPNGVLYLDDIDDENTTSSDRERVKTQKILAGTIFPTMTPETFLIDSGTPWTMNDSIAYMKATRSFAEVKTAIYTDGKPTWPQKFPEQEVQEIRQRVGQLEFARMYELNLEAAQGINLKEEWLHDYPAENINPSWPVVFGVDYASTSDVLRHRDRDYFALSIGRLLPGGGVVLADGVRKHLSQGEAIDLMVSMALIYPSLGLAIVETEGIGDQFLQLLITATALPVIGANTADRIGEFGGSISRRKGDRFEKQLGPLFRSSRIWISSAENPYLREFRNEWLTWPIGEHDDTLDATFYMAYAAMIQGALAPTQTFTEQDPWFMPKRKTMSPYAMMGRR